MRRYVAPIGVLLLAWTLVTAPHTSASDRPAQSFLECLARGGDIRLEGDDLTCRRIVSFTMRTYLAGTTECGEEVQYEIWDEIRYGTVTWLFAPRRTVDLPEVGETWQEALATPVPCDSAP